MSFIPTDITTLFEKKYGFEPKEVFPLTPEGSQREYFRVKFTEPNGSNKSLIAVKGKVLDENKAFLHVSECLTARGVALPKIISHSDDLMTYLQDDLGDTSLYSLIKENGFTDHIIELIKLTLDELIKFQLIGLETVDTELCFPVKDMDKISISWDLNYFKYCFIKLHNIEIDEVLLEREFNHLISEILDCKPRVLIHRDFQSRNVMIKEDKPWLIDFQGARLGPALYDAVSFLWQSRIAIPDDLKHNLLDYYIEKLQNYYPEDISISLTNIRTMVIFRMLQVLGAYGFRGLVQGKAKFREPIPRTLKSILETLGKTEGEYPYLEAILGRCFNQYIQPIKESKSQELLTVDVCSFSFKKSYPVDNSGNGGGFVFDCRGVHNPGRYEEYKNLTGYDQPVIDFFRLNSDIDLFLKDCFQLVDRTVEVYLKRGFTHLSVAFGCTGGRHRSLFSANAMAQHLHEKYPVLVNVIHREQDIQYTLKPETK